MRKAVIDLGTNTFNLLIAEWVGEEINVVYTDKEAVALGMGGINQQILTQEAMERAVHCLKLFRQTCDALEVTKIRAIATSAVRDATNNRFFCEWVYYETGIFIEIIDGLREAHFIYAGISYSHDFSQNGLVMDIGGGSTEFILAGPYGLKKTASFNIGVSRMIQSFDFQDPLSQEDIFNIERYLAENTQSFFENLCVDVLIGASGSFETFYELAHRHSYPKGLTTTELSFGKFEEILEEVIQSTQSQRDENPFIIPIRKKMAPIAAVKTRWVARCIQAKRLIISPCALKEGVLMEMK